VFFSFEIGDFLLHVRYGVGRFLGLERIEIGGNTNEFLKLEFAESAFVFIPVYRVDMLTLHSKNGANTVLDIIGKSKILQKRQKLKIEVEKVARELAKIAAAREKMEVRKIEISAIQAEYDEFLAKVPFDLTYSQKRAISEIFEDLRQTRPMDRLLCADVGFGKTEVALHAIFAVVKTGLKALFIVPTTILAQQHYDLLLERFGDFGIRVGLVSRMNDFSADLAAWNAGEVDVLIGTASNHGIGKFLGVSDEIGLIILDEEHHFGAEFKENVRKIGHFLQLSATPIPRTLNLALSKIKDISVLETPPTDKKEIAIHVVCEDEIFAGYLVRENCQNFDPKDEKGENITENGGFSQEICKGEQESCQSGNDEIGQKTCQMGNNFEQKVNDENDRNFDEFVDLKNRDEFFDFEEIIQAEVRQNGRVFLVVPRINMIPTIARLLKNFVKSVNFLELHGRLNPAQMAENLEKFRTGNSPILIGTSIVESGLNIVQAHLIVIFSAHRFGIAQLHQLKGRVGRLDKKAAVYFVIPRLLTEIAQKRFEVLQKHDYLGANYALAMEDLSIRGAGMAIGHRQWGNDYGFGVESYYQMLADALCEHDINDLDIQTSEVIELEGFTNAYIPEDFIDDEYIRINFYKKLSQIRSQEQMDKIKHELGQFGQIPYQVVNFLEVVVLRHFAQGKGILKICKKTAKNGLAGGVCESDLVSKGKENPTSEQISEFLYEITFEKLTQEMLPYLLQFKPDIRKTTKNKIIVIVRGVDITKVVRGIAKIGGNS